MKGYLLITPELLVDLLKGFKEGPPRSFQVYADPLPEDARIIAIENVAPQGHVRLTIESAHIKDGETILPPKLLAVFTH